MSAGDPRYEGAALHIFRVTPYPLDVAAKLAAEVLAAADAATPPAMAAASDDEGLVGRLRYVAHRLRSHAQRRRSSIADLLDEAANEVTKLRDELVTATLDR